MDASDTPPSCQANHPRKNLAINTKTIISTALVAIISMGAAGVALEKPAMADDYDQVGHYRVVTLENMGGCFTGASWSGGKELMFFRTIGPKARFEILFSNAQWQLPLSKAYKGHIKIDGKTHAGTLTASTVEGGLKDKTNGIWFAAEGLAAHKSGNYQTAMREWKPLSALAGSVVSVVCEKGSRVSSQYGVVSISLYHRSVSKIGFRTALWTS